MRGCGLIVAPFGGDCVLVVSLGQRPVRSRNRTIDPGGDVDLSQFDLRREAAPTQPNCTMDPILVRRDMADSVSSGGGMASPMIWEQAAAVTCLFPRSDPDSQRGVRACDARRIDPEVLPRCACDLD